MDDKLRLNFTNSTKPELLKLNEVFPDPKQLRGQVIAWATFEDALGISREDNRFKTVLWVWRKQLKNDSDIWTRADLHEDRGHGLRILTHDEQLRFSGSRYRRAGRQIVDGHAAAAGTDPAQLSEDMRKERDHRIMAGRHLHAAVIEARRFIPKLPNQPQLQPRQGEPTDKSAAAGAGQ